MKFFKGVVLIAAIHLVLSVLCLVWSFGGSMSRFDTGEPASMTETVARTGTEILFFPLSAFDSLLSSRLFPGFWGYIPFMMNSLLWGLVVVLVIKGIRLRMAKSGPAECVIVFAFFFTGMAVLSVSADDWPGARVTQVFSGDGRYFVRIVPGSNYGDTVGFKGSPKGNSARGEFYARQPDRSYKLLADVALHNPVAPVDALISNEGYLLTFDNWHNAGYGNVVAIYRPNGAVVATYQLDNLYKPEQIEKIPTSVSSRWWRCKPFGYVDPDMQRAVYVFERFGGTFTFELATGQHQYQPGRATCQS